MATMLRDGEHLKLCLQLILQSHLHQFDVGFTRASLVGCGRPEPGDE